MAKREPVRGETLEDRKKKIEEKGEEKKRPVQLVFTPRSSPRDPRERERHRRQGGPN